MDTEVWFRDADLYPRVAARVGVYRFAWNYGRLVSTGIDVGKFLDLYLPGVEWRALVYDYDWTFELGPGHTLRNPLARYRTWYAHRMPDEALPKMADNPIDGQVNRVVIVNVNARGIADRQLLSDIGELQESRPDCIFHVAGLGRYRQAFMRPYAAVDVNPFKDVNQRMVQLPNGMGRSIDDLHGDLRQWVTLLGYSPVELEDMDARIEFNMKSALWAGQNFRDNVNFYVRRLSREELERLGPLFGPPQPKRPRRKRIKASPGDKFLCDTCTLQDCCQYFRSGGVCSVPGAEPTSLSKLFKSRDADDIIEGLATVLASQTARLERGMEDELAKDDGVNDSVTKLANAIFNNGRKLAMLRNPALAAAGASRTNVNIINGAARGAGALHRGGAKLVAVAIRELEAAGIKREDITEAMLKQALGDDGGIIEAEIIEDNES